MELFRNQRDCQPVYENLKEIPLSKCPNEKKRPYGAIRKFIDLSTDQLEKIYEWCEELSPITRHEILQQVSYMKANPSRRDKGKDLIVYLEIDVALFQTYNEIPVRLQIAQHDPEKTIDKFMKFEGNKDYSTIIPGLCSYKKLFKDEVLIEPGDNAFAIIFLSTTDFVNMAFPIESGNQINYTNLKLGVNKLKSKFAEMQKTTPENCQITLVLFNLRSTLAEYKRQTKRKPEIKLEDIVAFLRFECNTSLLHFLKLEEISELLISFGKMIYIDSLNDAETEMDVVKRKAIKAPDDMEDDEKDIYHMQQMWIQMLTMIPRVSEEKAKCIAARFSCPKKLFTFLNDSTLSFDEKVEVLSQNISKGRNEISLARVIARSMLCNDPKGELEVVVAQAPKKLKKTQPDDPLQSRITNYFPSGYSEDDL